MPRHEFHNPYHFIPVKKGADSGRLRTRMDKSFDDLRWADSAARHDIYQPGKLSGRIICKLTTKSPMLNGGKQVDGNYNEPRKVEGFRGGSGLAASSLRGMVGSVMEAASNSAMRVLEEKPFYSYRQQVGKGLSAIGMFWDKGEKFGDDRYKMILLTPPTIRMPKSEAEQGHWQLDSQWRGLFAACGLRVYLGRGMTECVAMEQDTLYRTFDYEGSRQVHGMRVRRQRFNDDGLLIADDESRLHKKEGRGPQDDWFLIGQDPLRGERPKLWQKIATAERDHYVPGLLRILGCWGRTDIPDRKEHELFLPLTPGLSPDDTTGRLQVGSPPTVKVPVSVVQRFHELADERNDAADWLPYEPRDTRRNMGGAGIKNRLRLKRGDLVFFDVDSSGDHVTQISFSSIWRGRTGGTRELFFKGFGDKDILPLTPDREQVTVAEQMLGYVEEKGGHKEVKRPVHALASRLRFSDGILAAGQQDIWYNGGKPVKLRVLDSPKPPCASMYFKQDSRKAIKKAELTPGRHKPQGRKFYLHAWTDPQRLAPFETTLTDDIVRPNGAKPGETSGGWKQFSEATLLRKNLTYYFDVRFDNLKKEELQLLIYSLRPGNDIRKFWHKLGMGKPIGLGSVEIEPVGLFLVERQKRYALAGLAQARYTRGWVKPGEGREQWPPCYDQEAAAQFTNDETVSPARLSRANWEAMDPDIRTALETIGNPDLVTRPVHVPASLAYQEKETFAWFKTNEDTKDPRGDEPDRRQQLEALHRRTDKLPVLNGWEE